MSSASSDQATGAVLQALQTLYHDPDSTSKRRANEWLEQFQHSVEAWQTCHTLLVAPASPLEGRLFAAQTFRAKILYDLPQLPRPQLSPLRDSLLASLQPLTLPSAPTGSRAVLTQLCLALSDLALQMPEWQNVVGGMIEQFGKDPGTVGISLGFLKALVEEAGNSRIPLSGDQARAVLASLVSGSAERVLEVLTMYIQAPGITTAIQISVFETLRSWLQAGEVMASQVVATPLFDAAFNALSSDQLFDAAVDVLCDLVHETQEVEDNVDVIQRIVPRIVALKPQFDAHREDPDAIRGYCRLFCEAGETYSDLIIRHTNDLLPLVQVIVECAAYPDLEIVPITFGFWYILGKAIDHAGGYNQGLQPLSEIYARLQTIIIGHLHFPRDDESQTSAERDEFRMFRHRMGDTLKDCCQVLGATICLRKSYDLVVQAMTKPSPVWQEIEAPLFSMRSMGAVVDPDDDEVLPHIMSMLPSLPDHPRIRYAAILVLSRYTEWINLHPQNLAFQLQYISSGFQMAKQGGEGGEEVSAAAAHAMRFMCQDCKSHLVPFLPELLAFVGSLGSTLEQPDMVEICEAIGYVIGGIKNPEEAAVALRGFIEPLMDKLGRAAQASVELEKPELMKVADTLEQIDAYLSVIRAFTPFPSSCLQTASQIYQILDLLLQRYAKYYYISDRVSTVLRRGLAFFPTEAIEPILPSLMSRMVTSFGETGFASFIWIVGKVAGKFGEKGGALNDGVVGVLSGSLGGITDGLGRLLSTKAVEQIPDVMEDYVHLLLSYLTHLPLLTVTHPSLSQSLSLAIMALTLPSPEATFTTLELLALFSRNLQSPQYQSYVQPLFAQYGKIMVGLLLKGLVDGFSEDSVDLVVDVLRGICAVGGWEVEAWVKEGLEGVEASRLPGGEKEKFGGEIHEYLTNQSGDRLGNGVVGLVRAARRARERGRQARKSLGGGLD